MTRQVGDGITVTGGVYPRKTAVTLSRLDPVTVGNLLSLLAIGENGKPRRVENVIFVCNPQDYLQKVMPATTLMAPDGSYRNDVMPYPMTIVQSPALSRGEAVIGLGKRYFGAAGMADMNFNTPAGQTIDRHLLILYGNTGTYAAPVWNAIGKRVEDSSMEYDWGDESKTDILGDTYGNMKKPVVTQSFDPCELDAGDAYQEKLWNLAVKDQDAKALSNQDLLVVHAYTGDAESGAFAERYPSSMVKPSGLGGEGGGSIGMPVDVTFGGTRETGTAKVVNGQITFTAEV